MSAAPIMITRSSSHHADPQARLALEQIPALGDPAPAVPDRPRLPAGNEIGVDDDGFVGDGCLWCRVRIGGHCFAPLFFLQPHPDGGDGFRHQRAVLVLRLRFDEAHATPVLEHARFGEQPRAARAADERSAQVDGDHADRVRVQRARRGAQRHVEQRHDHAAVRGAEAVGELRLDRQRQARRAFAELVGLDLEVLQERDALLVVAREFQGASYDRRAAVDRDRLAGDVARGLGGEQHREALQVLFAAEAARRRPFLDQRAGRFEGGTWSSSRGRTPGRSRSP